MSLERPSDAENKEGGVLRKIASKWVKKGFPILLFVELMGVSTKSLQAAEPKQPNRPAVEYSPPVGDDMDKNIDSLTAELSQKLPPGFADMEQKQRYRNVDVVGFEKYEYLTKDEIQEFLDDCIPKNMESNIQEIDYTDEDEPVPARYGLGDNWQTLADANQTDGIVRIFKAERDSEKFMVFDTLTHEIGHLNDWTSSDVVLVYRLELLHEVIGRVQSPDRFKSDYVENIKNDDPKVELQEKATEYFAEIFRAYLDPLSRPNMPEADRDLVAGYIHYIDPEFNINEADKVRLSIIKAHTQGWSTGGQN